MPGRDRPVESIIPSAKAQFTKAQDNLMVLRGDFGGVRILLLSDLGSLGQNALLQQTNDLKAEIVISGIPLQGEPLTDALLDAIQPKVIVIADATYPAMKKAGDTLQQRLSKRNISVLYSRNTDAITLGIKGKQWNLDGMDGTHLSSQSSP